MLARFPVRLSAAFADGPAAGAAAQRVSARWAVHFRPGGTVSLRPLVPGLPRPPSASGGDNGGPSGTGAPAVLLPVMAMEVSSVFGGTTDPVQPFRDTAVPLTPEALRELVARADATPRLAVTLYGGGRNVSLGGGAGDYGTLPLSPLSGAPLSDATSVYVAVVFDVKTGALRESRELITYTDGGARFAFAVPTEGEALKYASVGFAAASARAERMWQGFKDHELAEL
jgi:hypothetical protein